MSFVSANPKSLHLLSRHTYASFIFIGIQNGFHLQSAPRTRRSNQVHYSFVAPQWLPFPGQTNEGEQSVFDPVPLARSRRVMTHRNRNPISSARSCSCTFHARVRLLLLPPPSAQISKRAADAYRRRPSIFHHRRMLSTANSDVSWDIPTFTTALS